MKRIISIVLLIATLLSFATPLAGCTGESEPELTVGQWLLMINDAFGMQSYIEEKPYFENIPATNSYFATVQTAAEWDVIDRNASIDVKKMLTWETALVTLVNAGNFIAADSDNDDKISYAIENFDNTIRDYWMNRNIQYQKAVVLLAMAQEKWAKKTFDTRNEKLKYREGVKNFTDVPSVADNYFIEGDTTVIPNVDECDLAVGDVYILPSNANSIGTKAYKVTDIIREDGKIVITNSDDVDLYDIAEEMFVQETIVPSISNAVIYDAYGTPLNGNVETVVKQYSTDNGRLVDNLVSCNNTNLSTLASTKMKHEFKVDDWVVELSYQLDEKLNLKVAVGKSNEEKGTNWKFGAGISNVKVTNEIDYKMFNLNYASVRVDYESEIFFEAGVKDKLVDQVAAPYNNGNGKGLTNLKKTFEDRFKNPFKDKETGKGAKTIKLCSIDVWSVGVARVCLDINFQIAVDGTFKITLTSHDSKGVEYRNNNIRFINSNNSDLDIEVKAKIEATFGIGPALYTIGLKKAIIGVQGKIGAGASVSVTIHLVDSENHLIEEASSDGIPPEAYRTLMEADISTDIESIQRAAEAQGGTYFAEVSGEIKLHTDVCINIALYRILRIEITDSSYAADLLGKSGKIKTSIEFWGEKNSKFAYAHIEDYDFIAGFSNAVYGSAAANVDQCTKKYKPFDNATEGTTEETTGDSILVGDQILLSEIRANIEVGQKYYIIVQQIPEGYNVKDLKLSVEDTKVASVDDGVVVGKNPGSTVIAVFTSDGKYYAYCALTVTENSELEFQPLGYVL